MLAVDPLMADPGDLFGEPLHMGVVDFRNIEALHRAVHRILDPQLTGAVDENFGHAFAQQEGPERRKIGIKINAADAGQSRQRQHVSAHWVETFEKSRSRAVNTRTGSP